MENKKNLSKIALSALVLAAAAAPGTGSASLQGSEAQGTFLAAGCASCGGKKGQIADNSGCGYRRSNAPQSTAGCGAQRGYVADNSGCGAQKSNAPQSTAGCGAQRGYVADNAGCGAKNSGCGAQKSYTADNTRSGDMYKYESNANAYQTSQKPQNQPGTSSGTYSHPSQSNMNQNRNNPSLRNDTNPTASADQRRQAYGQRGEDYSNQNANPNQQRNYNQNMPQQPMQNR